MSGDPDLIADVSAHVERTIGPIHVVWHETASEHVHVDVHHVLPTSAHPFHVLITSGMSERPMIAPPQIGEHLRRAELLLLLPPDWPLDEEAVRGERYSWPMRWLRTLAAYPHQSRTWLGYGHTVPNGDPARPFAVGTKLAGMLLLQPLSLGEEVRRLERASGDVVNFFLLFPLYAEELDLKVAKGLDTLLERFAAARVTDIIDAHRPNVAAKRRWLSF
jgi:hypothetical protein